MVLDDPEMMRCLEKYIALGNAVVTAAAVWVLNDGDGSLFNIEKEQVFTVLLKTGWAAVWGGYYLGAMRRACDAIDRPQLPIIPTSETNAYERLVPRVAVNVIGNVSFGIVQGMSYLLAGSAVPLESVLVDSICFASTQEVLELDANGLSLERIAREKSAREDAKTYICLQAYGAASFLNAAGRSLGF